VSEGSLQDRDTIDDLPHVHDYYAVAADVLEDTLKLQLDWVEYSRTEQKQVVRRTAYLCFHGVLQGTREPEEKVEASSALPARLWRLLSPVRDLKSEQDLIEQIRHPSTAFGEPLNYLERSDSGIIIVSHLSGEYLIRAQTVEWCDHAASPRQMS
jgi:hypothetical protein